jgi:hypothetical protein
MKAETFYMKHKIIGNRKTVLLPLEAPKATNSGTKCSSCGHANRPFLSDQ